MTPCKCSSSSCLINQYLCLQRKYTGDEAVGLLGDILERLVSTEKVLDDYIDANSIYGNSRVLKAVILVIPRALFKKTRKKILANDLFEEYQLIYGPSHEIVVALNTARDELIATIDALIAELK